jgi:hypothetical protein
MQLMYLTHGTNGSCQHGLCSLLLFLILFYYYFLLFLHMYKPTFGPSVSIR